MQRGSDVVEGQRLEVARQAIRSVAAAFKSIRLYSPGHALVRKGIEQAVIVLKSYVDRFGPLALSMTPRGVVVDFSPLPIDDDVISEFVHALRAGFVQTLRVLGGVSARELGEFLHILRLPQQQIRGHGGVSRLLRQQGIDSLLVDDHGDDADEAGRSVPALMQGLAAGADAAGAQLVTLSGGDADAAVRLIRDLDRALAAQPPADRQEAYSTLAQALLGTTRFHHAVQVELIRAFDEPFAISIAGLWPALIVEDLARAAGEDRSGGRAMVIRALGKPPGENRRGQVPVEAVAHQEIQHARAQLVSPESVVRLHALLRLVGSLPVLDERKCEACLHVIEREFGGIDQVDDQVSVLAELGALTRRMSDTQAEAARRTLHRILSTQVRDRVAPVVGQVMGPGHPLDRLAREAPDEAVLLLLELVAEESRLSARREIVEQLQTLAGGRIHLLAEHLVDPRWYIARNVVTVLGATAQPGAVPFLRAALSHADGRVRKEALHALAQIRTPEAISLMVQTLAHPDPDTQEAAAHWLGMTGSTDAAAALVTFLQATPLHEAVPVKRAAIRSLGRLGTPEAEAALQHIQSSGGLFSRRQIGELRAEAVRALAALREGRP